MGQAICTICGEPAVGRDWCKKHYSRWYRHGDPLYGEDVLPRNTRGVYSITCTANGWVYIGSSASVRQRWTTHKSWLRNGTHNVRGLQADWNEHGAEAFSFDLVSIVQDDAARLVREREHIAQAMATGKCYNPSPGGNGYRLTPEQRANLSEAMTGKPKSPAHRANLWANREATPEFREQMSRNGQKSRGKPKSAATRSRMSVAQRQATSVRKLTVVQVRDIRKALTDGESGAAIARRYGVTRGAISHIRAGRNWRDTK